MSAELESNVAIPEEPKKKTRARRPKKTEEPSPADSLIAGLKFIKPAQKAVGTIQQQYSAISGHWIAASNGILTIGAKIEDDLTACPHSTQLLDALLKCGHELSITQLSETALSVKSDKFKAVIPCVTFAEVGLTGPDEQIAVIDDRVKAAFDCVMCLATDGAPNAVHAAVLLQAGSAVATNGHALLEYWHGVDLPPGLLVPKASAVAIVKAGKPLTGFGYSGTSATFWFADGSFMKTQLYGERYPHYEVLFAKETNPWPLPELFFKAVHAVESFSKDGIVYFDEGVISSREVQDEAATYIVEGLPDNMGFQAKYLTMLEHAMKTAHFDKESSKVYIFGDSVRGILMGVDVKPKVQTEYSVNKFDADGDDIPF